MTPERIACEICGADMMPSPKPWTCCDCLKSVSDPRPWVRTYGDTGVWHYFDCGHANSAPCGQQPIAGTPEVREDMLGIHHTVTCHRCLKEQLDNYVRVTRETEEERLKDSPKDDPATFFTIDPGPFEPICSRDDFAKAAMQGLVTTGWTNEAAVACRAYQIADDMIKERGKQ